MKIAFVDDYCHKKTNSTNFLVNILKKEFEIKRFWRNGIITFPNYNIVEINKWNPDKIIFFQRIPIFTILKKFNCKKFIFIPMYDSKGFFNIKKNPINLFRLIFLKVNDIITDLLFKTKFITFSNSDFKDFSKRGKTILLNYYPKPKKQVQQKKPILFFWERVDSLPFSKLMKIINFNKFEKIYFMQRNDAGAECLHHSFYDLPKNVIVIDKWLSKNEYEKIMNKTNIAVAPRLCEGIGHSFLDYMSRGICVFAFNDSTHNEYIKHEINGLLFKDYDNLINFQNWKKLGKNARKSIKNGYVDWELNKHKLINWITYLDKPK